MPTKPTRDLEIVQDPSEGQVEQWDNLELPVNDAFHMPQKKGGTSFSRVVRVTEVPHYLQTKEDLDDEIAEARAKAIEEARKKEAENQKQGQTGS